MSSQVDTFYFEKEKGKQLLKKQCLEKQCLESIYHSDTNPNFKFFLHELLNPLNVISNCAELIDSTDSVTIPKFIDIILQQVDQCNYLSQMMLSQMIQKQEHNINLCHFLKDIKDKFETSFSTEIDLNLNVNCKCLNLKFNQVYLKIILDNILKNAYHYGNKMSILLEKTVSGYTISILNSKKSVHQKQNSTSHHKQSQSHMVGLELIDSLCKKMDIDWNLFEEENNYTFTLNLK